MSEYEVQVKRKIEVEIRPWHSDDISLKVTLWILPTTNQWGPIYPAVDIPCETMEKPLKGPLADPLFWRSSPIQILLGIEVLAMLTMECMSHPLSNRLISQETAIGQIIFGKIGNKTKSDAPSLSIKRAVHSVNMQELDKNIQKLWQFDDLHLCTKKDAENELVEELFAKTYYRAPNGRFVVTLPMKPDIHELGSSKEAARRRFFMQEKKFGRDKEYERKYIELAVSARFARFDV